MYKSTVEFASKTLTARERIKIKDTSDALSLDTATAGTTAGNPLVIEYDFHAVLSIENDKAENKTYKHLVIVDKSGTKFYTGSDSVMRALSDICDELADLAESGDSEPVYIKFFRKPSNNYKGKEFITCALM